jgi:hypothetical protein
MIEYSPGGKRDKELLFEDRAWHRFHAAKISEPDPIDISAAENSALWRETTEKSG